MRVLRRLLIPLIGVGMLLGVATPAFAAPPRHEHAEHHHAHGRGLLANTCASNMLNDIAEGVATHALWVAQLENLGVPPDLAEEPASRYEVAGDVLTLHYSGTAQEFELDMGRLVSDLLGAYYGAAVPAALVHALVPCVVWYAHLDQEAAETYLHWLLNPNEGAPPVESRPNPGNLPTGPIPAPNGGPNSPSSGGGSAASPEGSLCTGPQGQPGVMRNGTCYLGSAI